MRYYFIKDIITKGDLELSHCPMGIISGDQFTKPVARQKFRKFHAKMQGIPEDNPDESLIWYQSWYSKPNHVYSSVQEFFVKNVYHKIWTKDIKNGHPSIISVSHQQQNTRPKISVILVAYRPPDRFQRDRVYKNCIYADILLVLTSILQ